jgi:hypothetical protein
MMCNYQIIFLGAEKRSMYVEYYCLCSVNLPISVILAIICKLKKNFMSSQRFIVLIWCGTCKN